MNGEGGGRGGAGQGGGGATGEDGTRGATTHTPLLLSLAWVAAIVEQYT